MPRRMDPLEEALEKRSAAWDQVRDEPDWDVLVVGGGINGIGVFRDLAMQGVRVLLVERRDFCSGASAASSHMVHGGLRYLENGEFRLVREAVQERNRLLRNAPHHVTPLATVVPIFHIFSGLLNAPLKFLGWLKKPAERGAIVIKIGLWLYDWYTRHADRKSRPVPRHAFRGRQQSMKRHPKLTTDVFCTATYYDAAMLCPERLALDVLKDGAAHDHALAMNYVRAAANDADSHSGNEPSPGVRLENLATGETTTVRPRIIVNAAGPWIDLANDALGEATDWIGGTKGSHVVMEHPELREAIGDHEFFFENHDGRIVLLFPLFDRVLVGTSDLPCEDPDDAECTDEEVEYFLEMIRIVFPSITVGKENITYRYSGVRPLPSSDANTAGQISRDHSIRELPETSQRPKVLSLIGGKWTSFRAFSELATDRVLRELSWPRVKSTKDEPIGGGRGFPTDEQDQRHWIARVASDTTLDDSIVETLLYRYGTQAETIAQTMRAEKAADLLFTVSGLPYYRGELDYLIRHEWVHCLDDLLRRRTLIAMLGGESEPLMNATLDAFPTLSTEQP